MVLRRRRSLGATFNGVARYGSKRSAQAAVLARCWTMVNMSFRLLSSGYVLKQKSGCVFRELVTADLS